ncbi:DUF7511 domain-containing protein [Halegenticoccus tardaugens]|uniref:DUF7511 domain-containing protein n=1 Tax=Halegenticoccus tardaugens TaxID=2071624 RepID=UPI00100B37D9|nr:hypothetical protein [Halegenticoccus tardaugens]
MLDDHTEYGRSGESDEWAAVGAAVPDDAEIRLTAKIVELDDESVECTIYPPDATGMDLMTTWITAGEGSFVDLDSVR